MSDVVNLRDKRKEIILVCDCGCVSYNYTRAGMLRCSACGEYMRPDITSWTEDNVPPEHKIVESRPEHLNVIDMNDHVAALKRVANAAINKQDDLMLLMACYARGNISYWNAVDIDPDDRARIEWFRSRMEVVIKESMPNDKRNRLASQTGEEV